MEDSRKVGRWCGKRLPPEYSSLASEILVVFHTDFSFGYEGFRLSYDTGCLIKIHMKIQNITDHFLANSLVCGGRFDEEGGVITSPWYPKNYDDNKNCAYDIEAPLGKSIVLNFTDFDVEDECSFDSLSIYDGVDNNSTLIGRYCGTEKPPVAVSTMNHMHLIFQTDVSNTGRGFKAFYSFVDASECENIKWIWIFLLTLWKYFRLWWNYKEGQLDHTPAIVR